MKNYLKILLYIFAFCLFTFAFVLPEIILGTPASPAVVNWYQQFLPVPSGGQLKDIYFIDSLLGFAVSDSTIFKTTNGGNNWNSKQNGYYIFRRIHFLNSSTGYACAGNNKLLKTINSGENWIEINLPGIFPFDMSVVSEDSIWLVNTNGLTGGVFRTTNGGASWDQQLNIGSQNPSNIYFYNGSTGYISKNTGSSYVRKTTDGGVSWNININGEGFTDMCFADALTGYRAYGTMKKTTDGGLNWVNQILPTGGIIISSQISKFNKLSKDTIWGVGGNVFYGAGQFRGVLFKTTNGGSNWLFQVPDTSIHSGVYQHIQFIDKLRGWAYWPSAGVHTTFGGDPVWYMGLIKISENIPEEYRLEQNFPNPFNPRTNIRYNIKAESYVKLTVYDITGKEVQLLQDGLQTAGSYETDFMGKFLSSGVYFYRLEVINIKNKSVYNETKKMMLVK